MANPALKLDPSLNPLRDSLRDSLNSQNARISKPIGQALGGSGISGEGFKKTKEKIEDMSMEMTQALIEKLEAGENIKNVLGISALALAQDAINDNQEITPNINPDQAINDFGESPLPKTEEVPSNETLETDNKKEQESEATNEGPQIPDAQSTNARPTEDRSVSLKSEPDKAKAPLIPETEANPKTQITDKPANQPLVNPNNPGYSNELTENTKTQTEKLRDQSDDEFIQKQDARKASDAVLPKPEPKIPAPTDQPAPSSEESTSTPEQSETSNNTNPEKPTPAEEEPETPIKPVSDVLDALLPLVELSEDNPLSPKQSDDSPNPKESNQDSSSSNQDQTNPQDTPQASPERGKITQGINLIRNRKEISKIDDELEALYQKIKELQKDIKDLSNKITPTERKINLLRIAYWSSFIAMVFLMLLAAILALTIIFLFIIPLAPAVWAASEIPSATCKAIDMKMDTLKKEIKDEQEKKEEKEKELKKYQTDVKNLAIRRNNLKNQALLSRGNQNSSPQ